MTTFVKTTDSFVQGARTLPGRYYTSPDVLAEERERIFARQWLCIGRADQLSEPGSYVLQQVGSESIIVLRDRGGAMRAYYNVCRHRGTRLCEAAQGQLHETIQCPYHAWTYTLDGRLIGAPHMQDVAGFDKRDFSLHAVALEEWEGFLFLNLARKPIPFRDAFGPIVDRFTRFGLSRLVRVKRIAYDVRANWKLVFQNYNECLHCPVIHPELSSLMPYQSGENDLSEGPFLGGFMLIAAPNESMTISGRSCGLPLAATMSDDDRQRAYYYTMLPNLMLSVHPDYVNYYTLWPVSPNETRVICEWLVSPESLNLPNFDPSGAIEFWDITNKQDWHICEQSHAGIASRAYTPGPYSARESIPAAWDRAYLDMMRGEPGG
jgi:glycine betaine catabolism A